MEVVRHPIDVIWAPLDYTQATVFEIGQLVSTKTGANTIAVDGVTNMLAAAGASDTTNKTVPFGVITGTNNFTKAFDTASTGLSYNSGLEYINSVNTGTLQLARDWRGVEGTYPKNDPRPFVRIALVGPSTVIKAPLFSSTWGTAPTVYTSTAVNATAGLGFTTGAAVGSSPTAYNHTWSCRSGANLGLQRLAYDTSTTAHTFHVYWPFTLAIGDTFVFAPVKELGTSFIQFDAKAMFVDTTATYGSNYYTVEILRLDLRIAGQEAVYFKFNADQFCSSR